MSEGRDLSTRINDLQKERDFFLGKMYEVMAIISAGSFAVLVSFREESSSLITKIALGLFVCCMISCVTTFYCKAKSSGQMAIKLIHNPHIMHVMDLSKLYKFVNKSSWWSFILAYVLLLLNELI